MPDYTNVTTGQNGKIRVNGATIYGIQSQDVTERSDKLDASDAESAGFDMPEPGFTGVSITLRGVHKLLYGPWPNFPRKGYVQNLIVWLNTTDGNACWVFPVAMIEQRASNTRIKGQIEYTITINSWGTFTPPQG